MESPPNAWIVLPGHADVPARVEVERYSPVSRAMRTLGWACAWLGASVAAFLVTLFDPFLTSIPFFVGAVLTFRSWRGRFRVRSFRGTCPRCGQPLPLAVGAKIGAPHRLVCYHCHFEPSLHLAV